MTGLLYLAPALLLLLLLALGCYPGEGLLIAATRPRARTLHRPQRSPRRRFAPSVVPPRGGALLAEALAGRAPPG